MGIVPLMVFTAEIKKRKFFDVAGSIFQNKNDPTGNPCIRLSNSRQLLGIPNEFPLNCRQHVVVLPDAVESRLYSNRSLIWHEGRIHQTVAVSLLLTARLGSIVAIGGAGISVFSIPSFRL